eukprot:3945152-Pyramimonas_sp.AAC.1
MRPPVRPPGSGKTPSGCAAFGPNPTPVDTPCAPLSDPLGVAKLLPGAQPSDQIRPPLTPHAPPWVPGPRYQTLLDTHGA